MKPSPLSLSENPNPDLICHIERYGGKLGVLELISKLYQENPEPFDAICIKVGPQYTPTIILPGASLDENIFNDFFRKHSLTEKSKILIRGSLPGDYRSLVDVIPTRDVSAYTNYSRRNPDGRGVQLLWDAEGADTIRTPSDKINTTITDIRDQINTAIQRKSIAKYAQLTGVPFQKNTLSFGIIPKFDGELFLVTEHPNHEGVMISEGPFQRNHRNTQFSCEKPYSGSKAEKARKLLEYLREVGILDTKVAYHLELGVLPSGDMALFQIREICKKMPVDAKSIKLQKYHNDAISTILTTIPVGSSKEFKFESNGIYMSNVKTKISTYPHFGQLFGSVDSILKPKNLDPNLHGIMTQNFRIPGIGEHHNMRFIQYALQQADGGIVIAGSDDDYYINTIEDDFEPRIDYENERFDPTKKGNADLSIFHSPEGKIILKKLS